MSVKSDLRRLGWPANQLNTPAKFKRAIKNFQRGYGFGPALTPDGFAGPKTKAAIAQSRNRGNKCGRTITWLETASPGNGDIFPTRAAVLATEKTKAYCIAKYGSFRIFSWCRDRKHNAAVGGTSLSRHLFGDGVDFGPHLSVNEHKNEIQAWRRLERRGDNRIWHGDMKTEGGGTPSNPVVFDF